MVDLNKDIYTSDEVAERLGCATRTVTKYCREIIEENNPIGIVRYIGCWILTREGEKEVERRLKPVGRNWKQ